MADVLSPRVRVQLRLALLSDCGCSHTLAALDQSARAAGLTGAEIDAARLGRSFEVRAAALLAYACAVRDADATARAALAERARRFGLGSADLAAVRSEVADILDNMPGLERTRPEDRQEQRSAEGVEPA